MQCVLRLSHFLNLEARQRNLRKNPMTRCKGPERPQEGRLPTDRRRVTQPAPWKEEPSGSSEFIDAADNLRPSEPLRCVDFLPSGKAASARVASGIARP